MNKRAAISFDRRKLIFCSLPVHYFILSTFNIFSKVHFSIVVMGVMYSVFCILLGLWSLLWYALVTLGLKFSTKEVTSDFIALVVYDMFLVIVGFAGIYALVGIIDAEGNLVSDLLTCFYFSVITFTTLGYGDFCPTEATRLVAAGEAIIGFVLFAYVIGTTIVIAQKTLNIEEIQEPKTLD